MDTKTRKNSQVILRCNSCDYVCSRNNDMDKHKMTAKHKRNTKEYNVVTENSQNSQKHAQDDKYVCVCGKTYKYHSGLWKHKNNCKHNAPQLKHYSDSNDKSLIMMLIKDNADFKELLLEQNKMVMKICDKNNSTIHNNINSNNKTFNLQFFLNETCKDAMNIMDFVDSIQLQLSDLEKVGEIGFVEGISNIIVKNLKQLDITQRPVHCTDKKREILYIKDENKWEKEDEDKKKIRKIIKKVANKNIRMLQKFKEEHPDCGKSESKYSDQYNKLIVESMGGLGDNNMEKEDKIIKNIAKEVIIDKK
jgi:hypothetical protein